MSTLNSSIKVKSELAVFAAGCFWGVEEIIRKLDGVITTCVGYTGGELKNPTYEHVKLGNTGHAEAVQIEFDPSTISYKKLLEYFFRLHDPTTLNRQGNDYGTQYRSAIFCYTSDQMKQALEYISELERKNVFAKKIVTQVTESQPFYTAEEYHQKYLQKNPGGYNCHYLRDN